METSAAKLSGRLNQRDYGFETTPSNCPICGDSRPDRSPLLLENPLLRVEKGFCSIDPLGYYACPNDGLICMSPRLTDASLQTYYKHSPQRVTSRPDPRDHERLDFIHSNVKALRNQTVLDIGCNNGNFLARFKEQGFNVVGVEPSTQSQTRLKQTHPEIPVIPGTFQDSLEKLQAYEFSLINMIHLFEHLPDPNQALEQIHRLSPDYLFLEVPNAKSELTPRIYREYGHLYYYNRYTLELILAKHDFKTVAVQDTHGTKPLNTVRILAKPEKDQSLKSDHFPLEPERTGKRLQTVNRDLNVFKVQLSRQTAKWCEKIKNDDIQIALFGFGTDMMRILTQLEPVHSHIAGIMDSHPAFTNRTLMDRFPVNRPEHRRFQNVDAIIITPPQPKTIKNRLEKELDFSAEYWWSTP